MAVLSSRNQKLKLEDKIAKLAQVHEHLLPGEIDMKMIQKHIYGQGPTGEAGRLAKDEGIDLEDVKSLRLEYLRILKIDHLWVLPNLTKLQLNNNSIETIDNLHMLVHLRELDLSFNHIRVIENLEDLINLEVLHLYQNHISHLENMENLKKLNLLSLGQNEFGDLKHTILYLRHLRSLKSLNLEGNPMCNTDKFRSYVIAFLPSLVYFEYAVVSEEDKKDAKKLFLQEITTLEQEEEKYLAEREAAEKEAAEVELHAVSFVERLNGNQLFLAMFEDDPDGQALVKISEETKEFYETFCEEMTGVCHELFRVGQEQYLIRKREHDDFTSCVNEAKMKSQQASQRLLEDFLDRQRDIKEQIQHLLTLLKKTEQDLEGNERSEIMDEAALVVSSCTAEFNQLSLTTWRHLMQNELTLTEQMEEVNTTLERDMSDMVNCMLEQALGFFVEMRTLQESFTEQLTEASHRYLTMFSPESADSISPQLCEIMRDKESLSNALANSHEKHLLVIDTREDTLITRMKAWHEDVCESLQKKEISRSRERILEINKFLDLHREDFEELLSSRPDDLIFLMAKQVQEESEDASGDTLPERDVGGDVIEESSHKSAAGSESNAGSLQQSEAHNSEE